MQIADEADFTAYRGKLAGKIALVQPARTVRMLEGPIILRMTDRDLVEAGTTPVPPPPPSSATSTAAARAQRAAEFRLRLADFYVNEGVVAIFDHGSDGDIAAGSSDLSWQQQHPDGGAVFPTGAGARDGNAGKSVPEVTLAVEHYNRMVRVLDKGVPVKVELNVETKFYDEQTPNGINTIAEIPGSDLASEVVLLGAHLDSHPFATGATDNATTRRDDGSDADHKAVGAKRGGRSASRSGAGKSRGCSAPAPTRASTSPTSTRWSSSRSTRASPANSDNGTGKFAGSGCRATSRSGRLRAVDGAAARPRRGDRRSAVGCLDRSRGVRRGRRAGVSVHGRSP